ncbi:hypothetical protein P7228_12360 [Altererythrobacter arenosus]|uniref:Ammonium transporter n=1 Tax=Altererythrobacter arenosus TaxID=3032592 RepID=A0ABY8FP31_9SPHN|nr:hypothetical protein [Altererythrobacter sp. CAU 1644]WFL76782.1 hypothetical protein P7228_12360 [Altererythrobacter sp. CAU 1644]
MVGDIAVGIGFSVIWFATASLAAAMLTILFGSKAAKSSRITNATVLSALFTAASLIAITVGTGETIEAELILGIALITALGALLVAWPITFLVFRRYDRISDHAYSVFE